MSRARRIVPLTTWVLVTLSASCSSDGRAPTTAPSGAHVAPAVYLTAQEPLAAVLAANAQAIAAAPSLVPPGAPLAPFVEARLYAIANVAIHDALNAIRPRYARYADVGPVNSAGNPVAAVLTAAHDAIVGAAPSAQGSTDAWYATQMAQLAPGPDVIAGVTIGQRAAAAILARRANDGTAGGGVAPYHPGQAVGDYQFTFPFNTPAFDFFGTGGFADGSVWGTTVTPFLVPSTSHFRSRAPYGAATNSAAVLTPWYTRDFNEVKALGCVACAARTAEQSEIALFWVENSPAAWNRIARTLVIQHGLNGWAAARLFALLQMGEFDVYATTLESKYYHNFWRPVTAVELADSDGNPNTSTQPGWQVLAFPTPPVPDWPSAHASAGGAAASIIRDALGRDTGLFSTTSASLPVVTRSFRSLAQAASENAASRVYVGYHFRAAAEEGLTQGHAVGRFVAGALPPR
ncbi:MAG: vanadium-dependent haloperoxidase [Gemmatimonadetes bacterium]|nr:vanadium-dependent haloperoxidase [Gemmatimonadota bacterium]